MKNYLQRVIYKASLVNYGLQLLCTADAVMEKTHWSVALVKPHSNSFPETFGNGKWNIANLSGNF